MSSQASEESPVGRLVDALDVRRNAAIGLLAGVGLAVFGAVLVQASPYRGGFGAQDLVLLFVVLVSTAMLVTVGLTVRTVVRMTMSPPKWIRRGGTVAVVGGGVVCVAGLLAVAAVGVGSLSDVALQVHRRLLPLAVLSLLAGVWALHAANRHDYGYYGLAGAAFSGVGLVALAAVVAAIPGAFLGSAVRTSAQRTAVLASAGLAVGGTTTLGVALIRSGRLPAAGTLGATLALPVGLLALALVTALQAPALLSTTAFAPLGVAWLLVGYHLRRGEGIPPGDVFEFGDGLGTAPDPVPPVDDADQSQSNASPVDDQRD